MFEEGIKGWNWCVWEEEEIDSSPTTNESIDRCLPSSYSGAVNFRVQREI